MKDRTVSLSIFQETEIILKLSRQIAAQTTCSDSKRHSFGVPSRTSVPVPSVRIVLSEPFGADCIPGGVSPWGLDAGAPPTDLVLSGPGFPCGCVTPQPLDVHWGNTSLRIWFRGLPPHFSLCPTKSNDIVGC